LDKGFIGLFVVALALSQQLAGIILYPNSLRGTLLGQRFCQLNNCLPSL
jgi:hypothetical protein